MTNYIIINFFFILIINYNQNKEANLSLQSGQRHFVTQEQVIDVLNCLSKVVV